MVPVIHFETRPSGDLSGLHDRQDQVFLVCILDICLDQPAGDTGQVGQRPSLLEHDLTGIEPHFELVVAKIL